MWLDAKKLMYFMKKIHVKRQEKLCWRGEGTLPEVCCPDVQGDVKEDTTNASVFFQDLQQSLYLHSEGQPV